MTLEKERNKNIELFKETGQKFLEYLMRSIKFEEMENISEEFICRQSKKAIEMFTDPLEVFGYIIFLSSLRSSIIGGEAYVMFFLGILKDKETSKISEIMTMCSIIEGPDGSGELTLSETYKLLKKYKDFICSLATFFEGKYMKLKGYDMAGSIYEITSV